MLVNALTIGLSQPLNGFLAKKLESEIMILSHYKTELREELDTAWPTFSDIQLPSDCWRHVIVYLSHPRDILNLGLVNE